MSTDNEPQPCARCGEMTYLARDYNGCCDALCAEILDGLRKDDLIEELQAKVHELSRLAEHGNGPVLLGWMDAHKKAMDRVVELERKCKEEYDRGYSDRAKV